MEEKERWFEKKLQESMQGTERQFQSEIDDTKSMTNIDLNAMRSELMVATEYEKQISGL